MQRKSARQQAIPPAFFPPTGSTTTRPPATHPAEAASPRVAEGARVSDRDLPSELPTLVGTVSSRLNHLMGLVRELEAANAAVAEPASTGTSASGDPGSLASSLSPTEASEASLRVASFKQAGSSKKLQWADAQASVPEGGEEEGQEGSSDDTGAADAAAEGEKSLRKGFRRRTWAGPAWLDAVSADKVRRGGWGTAVLPCAACRAHH